MLHTIQLYYNKKGFSEATTLYTRRGDTGELLSATFKDEIDELLVLPEGTTTFDVSKVYFEAEGNGVFVRREVPAKYLDLTTPKKPKIKNFPMPAEMFAKGPNVVDNCYFRFELKTGAPTLDTDSPVTVSSSSFNTIVLGSPIPGIRSYYLDEIDYLIKEFEKAIAGYTPADIEAFYAELKAEIKLAKEQAKQDIEDLNALFVQSEADLRAKIVREIADMNKLIQNMQTSLDAQLLELQKQIDATKAQITTLDNKLVQVETDITNAKKEINQVKIDTTAQITKVKNDASTEINKIKNESILAVAAEKEAVIKMINELKAEIAAMDLEQLVLDLFAQGKVKDVMVAEIQKEVTKQLSEKGAASQTWVEENMPNPVNMLEGVSGGGRIQVIKDAAVDKGNVIREGTKLTITNINALPDFYYRPATGKPGIFKSNTDYTISGEVELGDRTHFIIRVFTRNADNTNWVTENGVLVVKTSGKFKFTFKTKEIDEQRGVIISLDAVGSSGTNTSTDTWTVDKLMLNEGIFPVPYGTPESSIVPKAELDNLENGYRWYDRSSKLILGRTAYNLLVKESTDWKYVATPSNLPEGVKGGGFHRSVFISDTYGFVEFVSQRDSSTYINSMAGGAWQGWKKTTMDGQAQKITADDGNPSRVISGTLPLIDTVSSLGRGIHLVRSQPSAINPTTSGIYIMNIYCIEVASNGTVNQAIVYASNTSSSATYVKRIYAGTEFEWNRLDGQAQKITLDSGHYKDVNSPDKTTLQAFKQLGAGVHFVYIIDSLKDTPAQYLKGIVTASNLVNNEITFIGNSMVGSAGTYSYNGKTEQWKRLDVAPTPAYPKEIPTASIGRYPTDKNTYQRDYIKAQLLSETLLKVVGVITIYQDATLPNSVTVASISKSEQLGGKKLPTIMSQRRIASVRNTSGSNYESELNVSISDTGSSINVNINIFAFKENLGSTPNKIYIDVDIPLE